MLSAKRLVTGFVALLAVCVYAALPGVEAQPQASSDLIYVPVMVSELGELKVPPDPLIVRFT